MATGITGGELCPTDADRGWVGAGTPPLRLPLTHRCASGERRARERSAPTPIPSASTAAPAYHHQIAASRPTSPDRPRAGTSICDVLTSGMPSPPAQAGLPGRTQGSSELPAAMAVRSKPGGSTLMLRSPAAHGRTGRPPRGRARRPGFDDHERRDDGRAAAAVRHRGVTVAQSCPSPHNGAALSRETTAGSRAIRSRSRAARWLAQSSNPSRWPPVSARC